MIRNIIFDWSGTLVDDLPAVWRATNYVLAQAKCAEMSLEQFREQFCLPFTLFYQRHVPGVSMPQLEEWFHRRFRQVQHTVCELPHAREFLEFCRDGCLRLFLLSTVHPELFNTQARATGFGQYLEHAYTGVVDKRERILGILEHHDLAPDQTLFVGDMEHDIETARHGGVRSCAVLTGYNTVAQLRRAKPTLIVEHLGELRAIFERTQFEFPPPPVLAPPDQVPIVTVGALIREPGGRVLMVRTQKWSDLWGIPGGKIKWGEAAEFALRREIKEETDLDVDGIQLVLVQDCIHSQEFYRDAHFVLLNYECRCDEQPAVKLNEEARDYRWVTLQEALALPLNRPTLALVRAVADRPQRI